ncbi:hypothetical protein FQN57_000681 [Myotisia sp. PD_48]|nr:hypothetical protein FQN57_000681 [Myotisia sp. PD_48]
MTPTIRVIGSLNADMVSVTPRFPEPGETLTATSFTTSAGGKGANQAVACGRLSRSRPSSVPSTSKPNVLANVEMVGAVGQLDAHFETLLKPALLVSGVDIHGVRVVENEHTGVAVIIIDTSAGGENRILFSPNANHAGMQPTAAVISSALAEPLPDIIVLQAEIPLETVVGILRAVAATNQQLRARGEESKYIEVVINPAPAPEAGLPDDVYGSIDHLIMNETECELMAPKELEGVLSGLSEEQRRDRIAIHFHKLGVPHVIVTLGSKGVWYSAAEPGAEAQADKSAWMRFVQDVPAAKVEKVVDTTAAGDTFVGGYSVQMAQWKGQRSAAKATQDYARLTREELKDKLGRVTDETVRWATKASARCVQRAGAMDSIPFQNEI